MSFEHLENISMTYGSIDDALLYQFHYNHLVMKFDSMYPSQTSNVIIITFKIPMCFWRKCCFCHCLKKLFLHFKKILRL